MTHLRSFAMDEVVATAVARSVSCHLDAEAVLVYVPVSLAALRAFWLAQIVLRLH